MAKQVTMNFRLNEKDKKEFAKVCKKRGLTMSNALDIFVRTMNFKKDLPFDIPDEVYFSGRELEIIMERLKDFDSGKGFEHDLIEVD